MLSSIDSLVGTLLVASWLDSGLFAIQIIQGIHYFTHYRDGWGISMLVATLFALNIVGLFGEYTTIYLDAITYYGDPSYLQSPEIVPRTMYLLSTQLAAFLVQGYLITRLYQLSESRILAVGLFLCALLALGGGLGLSIINTLHSSLAERTRQRVVTATWLAASAAVDILIAGSLFYWFHQVRKNASFRNTRSVLKTLMSRSIESGTVTAALATAVVALFYGLQRTNWPAAFVFLLQRAYSLTLLYNLNVRSKLQDQMHHSHSTATDETGLSITMEPPLRGRWRGRGRGRGSLTVSMTNTAEMGLGLATVQSLEDDGIATPKVPPTAMFEDTDQSPKPQKLWNGS